MPKRASRLNCIYRSMKDRCYNKNSDVYKDYGGRGITICDEWNNRDKIPELNNCTKGWIEFREWAINNGYSETLTIDRIDNNKGYSPENCRWVTMKEQCNNRRSNNTIAYKGETKNLIQWCTELNLPYDTIRARLRYYHWSVERAFETKIRK